MRKTVLLWLLCLCVAVPAQDFGAQWLTTPPTDSGRQVWFSRCFVERGAPVQATIRVATTGYFKLYVNGRNVSPARRLPCRITPGAEPIGVEFDVTCFLRNDTNVVAVNCSPISAAYEPLVTVSYSGRREDGIRFAYDGSEGWLCRPSGHRTTDVETEEQDGRCDDGLWPDAAVPLACWRPAERVVAPGVTQWQQCFYPEEVVVGRHKPRYFDAVGDSVYYEFGTAFRGYLRLTLRDTRKGARLRVDRFDYTCRGEADEQVYRRFSVTDCRRVLVCGPGFHRDQIMKVEGMEVGLRWHARWRF